LIILIYGPNFNLAGFTWQQNNKGARKIYGRQRLTENLPVSWLLTLSIRLVGCWLFVWLLLFAADGELMPPPAPTGRFITPGKKGHRQNLTTPDMPVPSFQICLVKVTNDLPEAYRYRCR